MLAMNSPERSWGSLFSGRLLLAIGLAFLLGCAQTPFELAESEAIGKLAWLRTADPERDYSAAVEKKDYRFRGLYGTVLVVPKVERSCISAQVDVNPIEGTSEVILGYEHAKLIAIAAVYAEDFNFRMRLFREKNLGFKCAS
jgi:hypothetical protein